MSVDVDYMIERMDDMKYCDFCRAILFVMEAKFPLRENFCL